MRFRIHHKIALGIASLSALLLSACAANDGFEHPAGESTMDANKIKNVSTPEAEKAMKMKEARKDSASAPAGDMSSLPVEIRRVSYDPANSENSSKALKEIESMQGAGWTLLDLDFSTSGKPVFVFQRPKVMSK